MIMSRAGRSKFISPHYSCDQTSSGARCSLALDRFLLSSRVLYLKIQTNRFIVNATDILTLLKLLLLLFRGYGFENCQLTLFFV